MTYLQRIADESMFVGDEIVNVMDIVSKNATKTVPTNITSNTSTNATNTVLINSDDKNVRYKMNCYLLHNFISDHLTHYNRYYLLSLHKT